MSEDFVLLHLSDAHVGNPKHELDSLSVLRPIVDDIQARKPEMGKPHLVVFSGDLVYGEIPESKLAEQFERAFLWLNTIYEALETTFEETPLLIAPGNHDLNKNLVDDEQIQWVLDLTGDTGANSLYTRMQENGLTWRNLLERQAGWVDFCERFPGQPWRFHSELNMSTGIINHGGVEVGVVGLNSSWGSAPQMAKPKGNLWIGKYQFQMGFEAIRNAHFKIAVAHHPLSWLNEEEEPWMVEKIESKFNVFLHGHDHNQWFNDSKSHLAIHCGAAYQGSTKPNGYSWTVMNFENRTAKIRLRQYHDKGSGGWGPLYIPGKTLEDGTADIQFPAKNGNVSRGLQGQPSDDGRYVSRPTDVQQAVKNLRDYVSVLEERFGFRWEPSSFNHSVPAPIVYWPIRLRSPTPIHAVQAFSAAGLQRYGGQIVLCVDDLGHQEYPVEGFKETIKKWFTRARGDESTMRILTCSEILESDGAAEIWSQVQKWLGKTDYTLEQVMKVSKLLPVDSGAQPRPETLKQRPRRLLTPAVVWSCLLCLHREAPENSLLTLAGYDERPLWQAWRECSGEPGAFIGHLYASELVERDLERKQRPVHMSTTQLSWQSREDIKKALEEEVATNALPGDWLDRQRLIPWCLRQCVLLPELLTDGTQGLKIDGEIVSTAEQIRTIRVDRILPPLVEALDHWLL